MTRAGAKDASAFCLAVVLVLVAGAAHAGPPFMTDDPEPVDLGHSETNIYAAGAIDANGASGAGPAVEVNYGAAPNLQLSIDLDLASDAPADKPFRMGVGDVELAAKYRFVDPGQGDWYPQVAIYPAVTLPAGNAKRGLGAGYVDVQLPIWLQKDFGDWTTYGGGGYWVNPGPGNRNYWFAGWLLQRQVTKTLALGAEIFSQTSSMVGQGSATGFSVGGTYDFSEHRHLLFAVGAGGRPYAIDAAAAKGPVTYYLGYQLTY